MAVFELKKAKYQSPRSLFSEISEEERLDALEKVQASFKALHPKAKDPLVHLQRSTLLQLWRDLVMVRQIDDQPSVANNPALELKPTQAEDAENIFDETSLLADFSVLGDEIDAGQDIDIEKFEIEKLDTAALLNVRETDVAVESQVVISEFNPISLDQKIVHIAGISEENIEQEIQISTLQAAHEGSIIESVAPIEAQSVDKASNEISSPSEKLHGDAGILPRTEQEDAVNGLGMIRLRLVKSGILHDMVLPEGTIISTMAADAEELISSGAAERLLIQTEPEAD